jgi:hypothetical protein
MEIDEALRQEIIEGAVRHHGHTIPHGIENAVDQWTISHARASAWNRAEMLWTIRDQSATVGQYETALDDMVAMMGRCLLLPVGI